MGNFVQNRLNFVMPDGYTARRSEVSGTTTYVGYSEIGEPDGGSWIIQRVVDTSGSIAITFSRGSWTDRATLTYS